MDASTTAAHWRAPEAIKRLSYPKFVPLLKAALAAAPARADLKIQLATALFQTHRVAEIVAWLAPVLADHDTPPELLYYLGRSFLATQDHMSASKALRMAADRGFAPAFGYLAEAHYCLAQLNAALQASLQGLERTPSDFKSLGMAATILVAQKENERLWNLCVDLRRRGVWGTYIPSAMALSATTAEEHLEVAKLVDPSSWLSKTQLPVPEDFNQKLAAELLGQKSLVPLPITRATLGSGKRIDQLQLAGGPLAQELLSKVRAAIEQFIAERQSNTQHPMIEHLPASMVLESWALEVHSDGREAWHIHPSGWISGVYYVQVPDVRSTSDEKPGAIEFGPYPFSSQQETQSWRRWHVMPNPGLLLLFPSYYAHRTWATGTNDPRICIAFDVVPSTPSNGKSESFSSDSN
jgi:uncharacterized protein (TIGR02466 family)